MNSVKNMTIAFLRNIRFCSYYKVGLGVVQMVGYVILKRHGTLEL